MVSDISVEMAGIYLECPVMNAAGTCKTVEDVEKIANSVSAAIVLGVVTLEPREGNPGEIYKANELLSLNCEGWPGPGLLYYKKNIADIVRLAHRANKPLIVNVGGFTVSEYAPLADFFLSKGADMVELNISCGNLKKGKKQLPIFCFDPKSVDLILFDIQQRLGVGRKIAVKLAPFSDPFLLREVAKIISRYRIVKAVTTSNTFPNALYYDDNGKPLVDSPDGLAGLGGPALKAIALGQVKQSRMILPNRIDIIGVGGIRSGQDVVDYIRAGAKAIQIGTALFGREKEALEQILTEYIEKQ